MTATREQRPGAEQWVPADADVERLRRAAVRCRGCELWEPATQVVFSSGRPDASIVMVGEQPGDVEDREGVPFVGPAGRLLVRAMTEAGIEPDDVYLTNAVKHFRFTPHGNRRVHQTPDVGQVLACRPWLDAELSAVSAEVLVVLGATAARAVLGPGVKVSRERGRVLAREGSGPASVVATVHPSSVLRARDRRDEAFAELVADLRVAGDLVG